MKSLATKLTVILFFLVTAFGYAQVEKTLVKSFNLKGKEVLVLDLDGDVEVQQWKNSTVRVQVAISLEQGNNTMLKALVTAGRYNLKSELGENDYTIIAPGLKKEVKIKGKPLGDKVSFIVYAPEDVIIKLASEVSTSVDENLNSNSSL